MSLSHINLQNFRNYLSLDLEIPENGCVLEGFNGSGKSNFLESIYMVCTARSQRNAKRLEMIKFDSSFSFIEADFLNIDRSISKRSIGFSRDKSLVLKKNDIKTDSVIDWFSDRPVISFGPNDLFLVYGTPEDRRKFIDILCSQIFDDYLKNLIHFKKSLQNRNHLLQSISDEIQISIYEEQMSIFGSEIVSKRKELISALNPFFSGFYSSICNGTESVDLQYLSSFKNDCSSKIEWKKVFFKELVERRKRDQELGFSSFGPHRDDISIFLNKKVAKHFCSQGQCRSIVLSLKLGSVFCLEKYRKETMLFLIDDAFSELDSDRTSRVFPLLEKKGQIFLAVPELKKDHLKEFLRFKVHNDSISHNE
jgi:DNA replication and repair protein RecF